MRLALIAMGLLITRAGWADSPRFVSVEPGKDAPLGVYAVIRSDCTVGAVPDIRVTHAPTHGAIVLQDFRFAMEGGPSCALADIPARRVMYRPATGFSGEDEVTFELVNRTTGQTDPHTVRIIVRSAPNGI